MGDGCVPSEVESCFFFFFEWRWRAAKMESSLFFYLAPPQLGQVNFKLSHSFFFFGVDSTSSRFRDLLLFTCVPLAEIASLNVIGRPNLTDPPLIGRNRVEFS